MNNPFDRAMTGLNRAIGRTFGLDVVFIDTNGVRIGPIRVDRRHDPVLIDAGGHGVVSSFQTIIGLDLHSWPSSAALPDVDWCVEIPIQSAGPDGAAGGWDVVDTARPGGAWLDLILSNFRPA